LAAKLTSAFGQALLSAMGPIVLARTRMGEKTKVDITNKTSLSVLVPVYNEESLVAESLRRLLVLAECPSLTRIQVVIVNDGSRDNTAAAIHEFLHDVATVTHPRPFEWIFLQHETNLGKGHAVQTALSRATGEISIIHDADLEYPATSSR